MENLPNSLNFDQLLKDCCCWPWNLWDCGYLKGICQFHLLLCFHNWINQCA